MSYDRTRHDVAARRDGDAMRRFTASWAADRIATAMLNAIEAESGSEVHDPLD